MAIVPPRLTSHVIAIVAAANSNLLPRPISHPASDMMPPVAATSATAMPHPRENAAITRCPGANDNCSIAQQAKANASTAEVVCVKSGQVNNGPYGSGHPGVQVTCEAIRKKPPAQARDTAGRQSRRIGGETRIPRAANATSPPLTATSTRATWNHVAVGMPGAPITLI